MAIKTFPIAVVLSVVIVAGGAYLYFKGDAKEMTDQAIIKNDSVTERGGTGMSTRGGMYQDYSDGIIAKTPGTKLLFFHAPWCPQCRALEADIEQQGVPDETTIFKVDYDNNQGLRRQYGVTLQTSFVLVDDEGKLLKKYVAYDNPTLEAVEMNILKQ